MISIKLLNGSKLTANTNAVSYAPAQGKGAIVKSIILYNPTTTSASVGITVGVRSAANIFAILVQQNLAVGARLALNDEITLGFATGAAAGDKLEMWASTDQTIQFAVSGIERDS